ncbi:MAG TPA: 23S rRNA (adenine(2503)-C(2))-methyltransferase RlmN [Thermoanaerobaculia bacterium]|nr:23S rRNA (adenine(2503)-C(2))-methyltransferase RlmN [Thermoanaerobaculia bacterium]
MKRELQTPTQDDRVNLYDLSPADLESTLSPSVFPPFRIRQIAHWLYDQGVDSFEAMSDLPLAVRDQLSGKFEVGFPTVQHRTDPAADLSQKYLFRLDDGGLIEAVYMPMGRRTTICLSSQAGCAVGCTFCVTGFFGAGRDLTPSEMLGQYRRIQRDHAIPSEQMNVVFMGMGEPLLNLDNVRTTLDILAREISPKRMTLSTSGIIPGIEELATFEHRPNLAVSINAPDRERREQIMPITRKYPLDELMEALRRFPQEKGREITIEYVLISGFNDSAADARALARLIAGIRTKVNAIPLNEDPNLPEWMKRPADHTIDRFVDTLVKAGVTVTVRRSKGRDIAAACGQLRGRIERRKRN